MPFTYSQSGILISILIVFGFILSYYVNLKPHFVVPKTLLHTKRVLFIKFLSYSSLFLLILIPLDIGFVSDKIVVQRPTVNVQILFDVSLSTLATDIKPNRFVAGRDAIQNLVQKLDGYDFSVIFFSGKPFIGVPRTQNSNALTNHLGNTTIAQFPPTLDFVGTAIGDAIVLGLDNIQRIQPINKKNSILILVTDGDSNTGIDPYQTLGLAQKYGVPIFVLGVGDGNYTIGKTVVGSNVQTSINIPLLIDIAEKTGGTFYRVTSELDFTEIVDAITDLVQSQEQSEIQYRYFHINSILYSILSLLLLVYLGVNIIRKSN